MVYYYYIHFINVLFSQVFVSTRKGGQQTALTLGKQARLVRDAQHRTILANAADAIKDAKLRGKWSSEVQNVL